METSLTTPLNIVDLIEKNPITRLNSVYQNKLLNKIKEKFTDNEQQMFVGSFYCYLNYNKNEFVIDLDDVWKWLGFSQKVKAKELLIKIFIANKDYIKSLYPLGKQSSHIKGGHNKETILLNIPTFKKMCLKADTKKADEIHDYFIKLEETFHDIIQEETNELKQQLEEKEVELENKSQMNEKEKDKMREKTLLEQFPKNVQCVYYGTIDNLSDKNEKLIKFGNSNNLRSRVLQHRDTYVNFRLINAFKVENKLQIEGAIKEDSLFVDRLRTITLKNKRYVELLNMEGVNLIELDKRIKDVIKNIEFSPENYIKILEENKLLKKELHELKEVKYNNDYVILSAENKRLKTDNLKIIRKYNTLKRKTNVEYEEIEEEEIEEIKVDNYGILVNTLDKYFTKNKDGTYLIHGKIYNKLIGSRKDVWNGEAYKTSGGLIKTDLTINVTGLVVSKRKSIMETINNRFCKYEVNKQKDLDMDTNL
jgi:hypothetical protein